MSVIYSTMAIGTIPFLDVRCQHCGRLIVRWQNHGSATLEAKCARCSKMSTIHLST